MLSQLKKQDKKLFLAINTYPYPPLVSNFFMFITDYTILNAIILIICLLVFIYDRKNFIPITVMCILFLIFNKIITNYFKEIIKQKRPCHTLKETIIREDCGQQFGKPSGHSCLSMSIAIVLLYFYPKAYVILLLPLLIGYSRIVAGKHYPSDVMSGWLLGFILAKSVLYIYEKQIKQVNQNLF